MRYNKKDYVIIYYYNLNKIWVNKVIFREITEAR